MEPEFSQTEFFNCAELVAPQVATLQKQNVSQRLWAEDATLWSTDKKAQQQIQHSLGWLTSPQKMQAVVSELKEFSEQIIAEGFTHVLLMGMGGSSLAAEVFAKNFSENSKLSLKVLDSTDSETIGLIEATLNLEKTLFVVATKSGNTVETLAFKDYFFQVLQKIRGNRAGENFVAITDPGTNLAKEAAAQGFRKIFLNSPDIGGRYSALSFFGLLPAALLGVNLSLFLSRAKDCAEATMASNSPALQLGAALGEMALQKRNKIILLIDSPLEALGGWIEQLLAESTGKNGLGLFPVVDEPLLEPSAYRENQFFVHIANSDSGQKHEALAKLREAGQQVISLNFQDKYDLANQFFLWEFATAVVGNILNINPFDQPNVQESKDVTAQLLKNRTNIQAAKGLIEDGLQFYSTFSAETGMGYLQKLFQNFTADDYVAFMAFLPENPETDALFQQLRKRTREKLRLPTSLGYGPRFLHSTGQFHKGGANNGIFLQLTADSGSSPQVPGKSYSFATLTKAEADGDLETLHKHGRPALGVHIIGDIQTGLKKFASLFVAATESL